MAALVLGPRTLFENELIDTNADNRTRSRNVAALIGAATAKCTTHSSVLDTQRGKGELTMDRIHRFALGTALTRTSFVVLAALLLFAGMQLAAPAPAAAAFCSPIGNESIGPDDLHYAFGQIAHISGNSFDLSCDVTVEVELPDGSVDTASVTTDSAGNFAYSYTLGTLKGDYAVNLYGQAGAQLTGAAFTNGPLVKTDKGDYRSGETVQITGLAFPSLASFTVRVTPPNAPARSSRAFPRHL